MSRIALVVIAVLLPAGTACAAEYQDPAATYHFSMPTGWKTSAKPIEGLSVVVVSPRMAQTRGNCNVIVSPVPGTEALTQAQIDAQLAAGCGRVDANAGAKIGLETCGGSQRAAIEYKILCLR